MRAVIYARYSSDNQTEASIEGQLRECLEYAQQAGIDIVGKYIDRALSARTDNRPEFQRMIKDSYKKVFDAIIVWKLDRFARNRYDSAHYKAMLRKNGVKVVSAKESIAEGSEGILLESVLEGMAEYYSAELSEKVIRGMTENVLKGRNNGGRVTYGYELDNDMHFCINPKTAPIVREIFQMYLEGKASTHIANYLNERKIPHNNDRPFTQPIIHRILTNRRYIGEYKFRDTVVKNALPAIISEDMFNAVQARIVKGKKAGGRFTAKEEYLLTYKLFCGKCGAHLAGESGRGYKNNPYHYYKCSHTKKVKTCDKKAVRKDWIENLAIERALNVLNDDNIIKPLVEKCYNLQGEENPHIPILKQELENVTNRLYNVVDAIEQGIILPTTKERLHELEQSKKQLEIKLLEEQLKRPALTREQIEYGIQKFKELDITTLEGKRRLIDGFINSIYLYEDRVVFNYNYREGTETVPLNQYNLSVSSGAKISGAPKKGLH